MASMQQARGQGQGEGKGLEVGEKRIVLITGANSGIGLATATLLACSSSPTYHIIVAGRALGKVHAAVETIRADAASRGTVSALQLDITDENSIARAVKSVEGEFGRVDVLVNNAGVYVKGGNGEVGVGVVGLKEQFEKTLATNVIGTAMVTEAFTPLLLRSTSPYLLHISSAVGSLTIATDASHHDYGIDGLAYRISKAGLNMLATQDLKKLGGKGVKVFAICPGLVESNLRGPEEEARTMGGLAGKAEGSARLIRGVVEGEREGDVGRFVWAGGVYPW